MCCYMPNNGVPDISVLERTGFPQVLLYLYAHQNQEVNQDDVIRDLGPIKDTNQKGLASATVRRAIEYAEQNKFITIEKTNVFPWKYLICLTEKGLRVGKLLASVVDVLRQDVFVKEKSKPQV